MRTGGSGRLWTPVFSAVAYPGHVLWVPLELWIVNVVGSTIVGLAVGVSDGTGIRTELTAVVGIAVHLFFARAYRRDRHVVNVWRARFGSGPMAPRRRLPSLIERGRVIGGEP